MGDVKGLISLYVHLKVIQEMHSVLVMFLFCINLQCLRGHVYEKMSRHGVGPSLSTAGSKSPCCFFIVIRIQSIEFNFEHPIS